MNLDHAAAIAQQLLEQYGLPANGWRFRFDNASKRAGLCAYGPKIISLSRELTERNGKSFVIDTVLHEIAHALAGASHGHDAVWKKTARAIGCTAEVCHRAEIRWRFVGMCAKCGVRVNGMRKHRWSCGRCSPGVYSREAIFKWKPTDATTARRKHSEATVADRQLVLGLEE